MGWGWDAKTSDPDTINDIRGTTKHNHGTASHSYLKAQKLIAAAK